MERWRERVWAIAETAETPRSISKAQLQRQIATAMNRGSTVYGLCTRFCTVHSVSGDYTAHLGELRSHLGKGAATLGTAHLRRLHVKDGKAGEANHLF